MRALLPGLRCHIVTRLTTRSRSVWESAQERLGAGKVGDDVAGRTLAPDHADGLTGPHRGFAGPLAVSAQLVLAAVPLLGERVAQRAAAVLRRPRNAAPDVEHGGVDRVRLARRHDGAARGRLVQALGTGEEGGPDECPGRAGRDDGGQTA